MTSIALPRTSMQPARRQTNRYSAFWAACKAARLPEAEYYKPRRIAAVNRYFGWNITSLSQLTDVQLQQAVDAINGGAFYGYWELQRERPKPDYSDPETRRRCLEAADVL
jgi:hypothetical protein